MTNNDILRQIRYTFDYKDGKMADIFSLANQQVTRSQICNWLIKDDHPDYASLNDKQLATFLNGFIIEKRGKKEGEQPVPENQLNNNIIFRKLKIALQLNDEAILEILALAKLRVSKHELSAFFRNPKQRQYRECKDQILRNFLKGMRMKYKG